MRTGRNKCVVVLFSWKAIREQIVEDAIMLSRMNVPCVRYPVKDRQQFATNFLCDNKGFQQREW